MVHYRAPNRLVRARHKLTTFSQCYGTRTPNAKTTRSRSESRSLPCANSRRLRGRHGCPPRVVGVAGPAHGCPAHVCPPRREISEHQDRLDGACLVTRLT